MEKQIRIEFIQPVLGTLAGNKEIAAEFIVGRILDRLTPAQRRQLFDGQDKEKALIEEQAKRYMLEGKELEGFPEDVASLMAEELDAIKAADALDKASTVFPRDGEGHPILWDYQIKGQLKGGCEFMHLAAVKTKEELKTDRLTQYLYKKTIDLMIQPHPRQIRLHLPNGDGAVAELPFNERPLRAETQKGARVCLARSEMCPIGTWAEFTLRLWNDKLWPYVQMWLGFGAEVGMLQWRSGGWGRFTWQEVGKA